MARSAVLIAAFLLSISLVSFSDAEKPSEASTLSVADFARPDASSAAEKTLSVSYIPVRRDDLFHVGGPLHELKGDPKFRVLQRQHHFKMRNFDWDNTLGKKMDGKMVRLSGCGGGGKVRMMRFGLGGRRMRGGPGFHHYFHGHHHQLKFLQGEGEHHHYRHHLRHQARLEKKEEKSGLMNWFRDFLDQF